MRPLLFLLLNISVLFGVSGNIRAQTDSTSPGEESIVETSLIFINSPHLETRVNKEIEEPVSFYLLHGYDTITSPLKIYSVPTHDRETEFSPTIHTDAYGIYHVSFSPFPEEGTFNYTILDANRPETELATIEIIVRKNGWVFMMLVGLFGGLSLFIVGMSMMSEGMQNSAGNRMRSILGRLTHNRFMALGMGALVTMIIQSSSATNVMLVSFVNSRLMRFRQTIGIILGAALGTTITAQIIAFKITDYALLFVTLGLVLQLASKQTSAKEIGKAILGFGVLFYGMHIMSESMYPLRSYDPFIRTILHLENPFLGILIGALLTALIQSSSAFIGILIVLAMQGLLTLNAAIPLLIGANIGTAITALLASINTSREARQVAFAHTLFKAIGGLIIVFFIPSFTQLVSTLSSGEQAALAGEIASPRQIANAHTIFNILLCLLFLPITNSFAKFVTWLYPSRETETASFKLKYIHPGLLVTPSLALEATRQELVRMMGKVYDMTEMIITPFLLKDKKVLKEIAEKEEEIDYLRDQIGEFLIRITRNKIAEVNTEESFIMMNAVREFEEIADIISGPMKDKATSWCSSGFEFSEKGKEELTHYHQLTLGIIEKAIKVYKKMSLKKATKLKARYDAYRESYFELEQQHYKRLLNENEATIGSSKTHLEIITHLKVISSHATNTSRILMYELESPKEKNK